MNENCLKQCKNLQSLTGIPVTPLSREYSDSFYELAAPSRFCTLCPYQYKNEVNTHLYGLSEAYRWDGQFIYYCPMALIFVAVAVLDKDGEMAGGMIAGPIVMGNAQDSTCYIEHPEIRDELSKVAVRDTTQVQQLADLLSTVANSLYYESFSDKRSYNQQKFLNTLYDMRAKYMDETEHYTYIVEAESQLCALIADHDKSGSQDLLNRLLGHIFFYHAGNLQDIKARTMELIVVISRAVISAGADIGEIFRYSTSYAQGLDRCTTIDELSRWVSEIIHQFISVSFDYMEIKHSDIVHKATAYIRKNCHLPITLEDISNEVFLSKSYLSSIFKQETGISISAYINKSRVERSKVLLTTSAMSLVDIACECGFGDQSYFSRVFKKYTGESPKQYRSSRLPMSEGSIGN